MSERIDKLEERIEALEDHTQDIDEEWMNAPAGPYPDAPKQVHACEFCGCDIEHGERVCSAACLDMLINEFVDNQEQAQPDSPTDELLPCPFCGSEAFLSKGISWDEVRCKSCRAGGVYSTSHNAVAAWNRRDNKELAAARKEIKRLKATLAAKEQAQSTNEEGCAEEIKELKDENKLLNEAYDILLQINSDIDPRDVLMENATLEDRIEKALGQLTFARGTHVDHAIAALKGEKK